MTIRWYGVNGSMVYDNSSQFSLFFAMRNPGSVLTCPESQRKALSKSQFVDRVPTLMDLFHNPKVRPPVQGVLLDVNETLFSLKNLEPAFMACDLDPALMPLWFARVLRDGFALAAAEDFRRFADIASGALIELAPNRIGPAETKAVLNAFRGLDPHPDVQHGLRRLYDAGVRVMTLTVGDVALSETLFERAGLRKFVHGFLSSDTVRRWKPAPESYHYGITQIGRPAANVALIAAHSWDIHGAQRVGLQTGFVRRNAAFASPVFAAADVTGADLLSVVEQLLM